MSAENLSVSSTSLDHNSLFTNGVPLDALNPQELLVVAFQQALVSSVEQTNINNPGRPDDLMSRVSRAQEASNKTVLVENRDILTVMREMRGQLSIEQKEVFDKVLEEANHVKLSQIGKWGSLIKNHLDFIVENVQFDQDNKLQIKLGINMQPEQEAVHRKLAALEGMTVPSRSFNKIRQLQDRKAHEFNNKEIEKPISVPIVDNLQIKVSSVPDVELEVTNAQVDQASSINPEIINSLSTKMESEMYHKPNVLQRLGNRFLDVMPDTLVETVSFFKPDPVGDRLIIKGLKRLWIEEPFEAFQSLPNIWSRITDNLNFETFRLTFFPEKNIREDITETKKASKKNIQWGIKTITSRIKGAFQSAFAIFL